MTVTIPRPLLRAQPKPARHRVATLAASLLALGLFSACATLRVGVDHDPGVSFDKYQTFAWDQPDALPVGDPRLDNNPFFDSRVRAAVELELATKGLRLATASPDLLVHYHASVQQRVDVLRRDQERGYTSPGSQQATDMIEYDEGTLVIDIADAKAKNILWRGWAQTDVSGLIDNPRELEKRIRESVRRMIEKLPRTAPVK